MFKYLWDARHYPRVLWLSLRAYLTFGYTMLKGNFKHRYLAFSWIASVGCYCLALFEMFCGSLGPGFVSIAMGLFNMLLFMDSVLILLCTAVDELQERPNE